MQLLGVLFNDINEEIILRLIEREIPENKALDYKKEIKIEQGDDKKEFLYDIISFANTDGGILIYGVDEKRDSNNNNTGLPNSIVGVDIENPDKFIQQLEETVKYNTEPQISSLSFKILIIQNKTILIIGIPKTFWLPHMVTYKSTNKFYRRRNSGKYLPDVHEINEMFMAYSTQKQIVSAFIEHRIQCVRELNYIQKLDTYGSFFLHIIPVGRLGENLIDITNSANIQKLIKELKPIKTTGWDYRFNFEGILTFDMDRIRNETLSYIQLFRDGALEYYTSKFYFTSDTPGDTSLTISMRELELSVIDSINKAKEILSYLKIDLPLEVRLSLFDCFNTKLLINPEWREYSKVLNREKLILPPIVINSPIEDVGELLKPIFDIIYQAGDIDRSPFYDDNGKRIF